MKTTLALVLLLATLCVAKKSYEGYKVFRIIPKTEEGKNFISELAESEGLVEHLDFWRPSGGLSDPTDVMVPPKFIGLVEDFLHRRRMEFSILIENVEDLIQPQAQCSTDFSDPKFYNCYHTLEEIEAWMKNFAAENTIVTEVQVSTTFEGRSVSGLRISTGEGHPAVIFQGGIHAREWISPATMMNLAKKFVENSETGGDVQAILGSYDIYIVPVLNADGYKYSWEEDRMWRKNRNTNGGGCVGVDLNRNWNVNFGGDGATRAKCGETYHGEHALSEPETSGMDEFAKDVQEFQEVHVFIDFHSYGQYWMWPWGYAAGLPPTPDHEMQAKGCSSAVSALTACHGTDYTVQTSAAMYPAAGATEDWAYHSLGAKYSYIVELRPETSAGGGFILPARQIEPTGEETFEGVKALLLYTMTDKDPIAQKVEVLPVPAS